MSTRSTIAFENHDGTITSIYSHWDGYLNGVGRDLLEYYQDSDKIRALLALGDISSLGKEIGETHDFDAYHRDWTTAYGRDRGEKGTEAVTGTLTTLVSERNEYLYLYRLDGKWWFMTSGCQDFQLLTHEAIEKDGEY